MNKPLLPSFLCIGAQKAGTTTIHDWFSLTGNVVLPRQKETHFFSDQTLYEQGLSWYFDQYPCSQNCESRGEVDPEYLYSPGAPARVATIHPEIKLLVLLRNPIERAISHHRMLIFRGVEDRPLEAVIKQEFAAIINRQEQGDSIISRGLYGLHLGEWLKYFAPEQFLVIKSEDLFTTPNSTGVISELVQFLGLPESVISIPLPRSRVAKKPRIPFLANSLYRPNIAKKVGRLLVPRDRLRQAIWLYLEDLAFNRLASITKISTRRKEVAALRGVFPAPVLRLYEKDSKLLTDLFGVSYEKQLWGT